MATLRLVGTLLGNGGATTSNLTDLSAVTTAQGIVLAGVNGFGGGFATFLAADAGSLAAAVSQNPYPASVGHAPGVEPEALFVDAPAGRALFAVGMSDAGSRGVRVGDDGAIVASTSLPGLPRDVVAAASVQIDGAGGLVTARSDGQGLQSWRIGTGGATLAGSAGLPEGVAGGARIGDLTVVTLNGQTLVLGASAAGGFLASYRLGADGALVPAAALAAGSTAPFAAPREVEVAEVAGVTYAVVAGAGSNSLTVLRLDPGGAMDVTDHILDERGTRFEAATELETVTFDGRVYVFAAGADDGLSMFTLLPGGRLLHLGSLADTAGAALADISALTAVRAGDAIALFAASATEPGISQIRVDPGPIGLTGWAGAGVVTGSAANDLLVARAGTTSISGGQGDDILGSGNEAVTLTGGAGRDLFIPGAPDGRVIIADFHRTEDRLDLSLLGMIRSTYQLTVQDTGSGLIVRYGATTLDIRSHDGNALSPAIISNDLFPVVHYAQGARAWIAGTGTADEIAGPTGQALTAAGLGGDDTLAGGVLNDDLDGGAGNDRLSGGDGHDTLAGADGDDAIDAGSGNDLLTGGAGLDTLDGGRGHDRLSGDAGDDILIGNLDHDYLSGGDGRDSLSGGYGNDSLHGDRGADTLMGYHGDDLLVGGDDNDTLRGGNGNDTLYGSAHDDSLWGEDGQDLLAGGAGRDRLWGGDDGDILYGGLDDDRLDGGAGDDLLYGEDGADTIVGGLGHDTVVAAGGDDSVDGGDGDDRVWGQDGNDALVGGAGLDSLWGEGGDDRLDGGDGDDLLGGGVGNDVIRGEGGRDRMIGEEGSDLLSGGDDNDTLVGREGDDSLYGDAGDDLFAGHAGRDELHGGEGNDALGGGLDDDRLWGDAGNDTLIGGGGRDMMDGGDGDDMLMGAADAETLVGGEGQDQLFGSGGDDLLGGGGGNDSLSGGEGSDSLSGDGGRDLLVGGAGHDVLAGGDDADTLDGGTGNDTLAGGAGSDLLVGREGVDRFVFIPGDTGVGPARDWIRDYEAGEVIDLTALALHHADEFSGTPGELILRTMSDGRFAFADLDGDGVADFELRITGATAGADAFLL